MMVRAGEHLIQGVRRAVRAFAGAASRRDAPSLRATLPTTRSFDAARIWPPPPHSHAVQTFSELVGVQLPTDAATPSVRTTLRRATRTPRAPYGLCAPEGTKFWPKNAQFDDLAGNGRPGCQGKTGFQGHPATAGGSAPTPLPPPCCAPDDASPRAGRAPPRPPARPPRPPPVAPMFRARIPPRPPAPAPPRPTSVGGRLFGRAPHRAPRASHRLPPRGSPSPAPPSTLPPRLPTRRPPDVARAHSAARPACAPPRPSRSWG